MWKETLDDQTEHGLSNLSVYQSYSSDIRGTIEVQSNFACLSNFLE